MLEGVGIDLGESMLIPDISVVRAEPAVEGVPLFTPADVVLAVEIVSPLSRKMDRLVKPAAYAEAGIASYWRVELDAASLPMVVVHDLADGGYRESAVVPAGAEVMLDQPYPLTLAPATLVGPRA
ncbi:MAG TPA: Uma2 family endonuclease [Mycobacteriales bacterium]|nr:Uma2 family endonuclease [Mycobacteriales bacterium]